MQIDVLQTMPAAPDSFGQRPLALAADDMANAS
jgi:hypothetical protein